MCVQHINSVNGHENRIFMKNDLSLMREFIIQIKRKKKNECNQEIPLLMKKRHTHTENAINEGKKIRVEFRKSRLA